MMKNPKAQEDAVMAILKWWNTHKTDASGPVLEEERKTTLVQLAKLMDSRSAKVKA